MNWSTGSGQYVFTRADVVKLKKAYAWFLADRAVAKKASEDEAKAS